MKKQNIILLTGLFIIPLAFCPVFAREMVVVKEALAVLFLLAALMIIFFLRDPERNVQVPLFYRVFLLLIIYGTLSFFIGVHARNAWRMWLNLFTAGAYSWLFFVAVSSEKNEKKFFFTFALILSFAGAFGAVVGFFQKAGIDFFGITEIVSPGLTFGNKNHAAHWLIMILPLSIYASYESWKQRHKRAGLVFLSFSSMILISAILLIIGSRGAFVGLFLAFSLWMAGRHQDVLRRNRFKVIMFFFMVLICFALIYFLFSNMLYDKLDDNVRWRLISWKNTASMFCDHFWFGVGAGHWKVHYPLYSQNIAHDVWFTETIQPRRAHNDFLQIMAEWGIIGFSLFLFLFGLIIKNGWKSIKKRDHFRTSAFLGIIALLGHAFFSFPFQLITPTLLFFCLAGLLLSQNTSGQNRDFSIRPVAVILILLTGPVLLWNITRLYSGYYLHKAMLMASGREYSHMAGELKKARAWSVQDFAIIFHQAQASHFLGEEEESLSFFSEALKIRPYYFPIYLNRSVSLQALGWYKKALADINRCLDIKPNYSNGLNQKGVVFQMMGRHDDALEQFERAYQADSGNEQALYNLGLGYSEKGQFEKAVGYWDRFIALDADEAQGYFLRAGAWQNLRRKEEAYRDFQKAHHLDPGNLKYLVPYMEYVWMNKEKASFFSIMDRFISRYGRQNPFAYLLRAEKLESLSRFPEAVKDYEIFLSLTGSSHSLASKVNERLQLLKDDM